MLVDVTCNKIRGLATKHCQRLFRGVEVVICGVGAFDFDILLSSVASGGRRRLSTFCINALNRSYTA